MMRVAICGGTFDPFHRGHLDPVLAIQGSMQWDCIVYVPAFRQPFKLEQPVTSGYHRFAMAVLATADIEAVTVSPWELERGTISYTVETLDYLRARYPEAALELIIGDDNLAKLDQWKAIDRLFQLANVIVLSRGGTTVPSFAAGRVVAPDLRSSNGAVVLAANEQYPVSSTEIRDRVANGSSLDGLVDPRVSRYIQHNHLYSPQKGHS